MTARRLIGIDLAWSENNGTGCAELVRDRGQLTLTRIGIRHSLDDIVNWIDPECGDWVVAVDAPLVICNQTGSRAADQQPSKLYQPYEAGAYPANLDRLGKDHRGGQLLRALKSHDAALVEQAADINDGRLTFETYPHIVMVELFGLKKTIKYKKGRVACRRRGQRKLAKKIRHHLCSADANPRLHPNDKLDDLLHEPDPILKGRYLKHREDRLDALICAYTAAWLDAERPLLGLGQAGAGVMLAPRLREIAPPLIYPETQPTRDG